MSTTNKPQDPQIQRRKVTDFTPDDRNANKGTERGLRMLDDSLSKHGAGRSILVDKNGRIIAGNKTQDRAVDLGIEDAIVVQTDGKQLVVVQRTDIDLDSKPGRELALADNRISQIDLDWSAEQLAAFSVDGIDLGQFWTDNELLALFDSFSPQITPSLDTTGSVDRADALQAKWNVNPGDLWGIGSHRILCGDCQNPENIHRLMGPDHYRMIWTDPPYGVNYASLEDSRVRARHTNNRKNTLIVIDDLKPDEIRSLVENALSVAVPYADGKAALYLASPAGMLYIKFVEALLNAGFSYRQQLIWLKNAAGFGRTHYHYKHEPIIYGWLEGTGTCYFVNDHTKTTIIEAQKPTDSDEHPTMKPPELIAQMIENSSHLAEIVYDPFSGSGSTLIACEQTGRHGRAIEIEPKYVSVTLERLTAMGLEAVRL